MSEPQLPDYVVDLINGIAKTEGFNDFKIDLQAGSKHGDGFVGIMTSAVIVGERNGVPDDRLSLLCKLVPTNAARRAEFQSEMIFEREVLAYNELLPIFIKFQKEKGLTEAESFNSFPKCFAAVADKEKDQFLVIMEDLRPKGYVMRPKAEPVSADEIFLFVERLAKFHAVSFAIKDQRPEIYAEFRKIDDILTKLFKQNNMAKLWGSGFERAKAALKDRKHVEIIEDVEEHLVEYFNDCLKEGVSEPFGVIGHGDCWNNNILFEYEDEEVRIIRRI